MKMARNEMLGVQELKKIGIGLKGCRKRVGLSSWVGLTHRSWVGSGEV